jgi:DNA-binding NarL/FixJ family response regulator
MSSVLRILVVDDHEVVRRGLKSILEGRPDWEVVGEAATGREAVEKAQALRPEIVILDMSMPELNGLEATRSILKAVPEARVLVLTQHDSDQLVQSFLQAGAQAYLVKSDAARDLVPAVESLQEGRPFFTARVGRIVLDGYLKSLAAEPEPAGVLTASERQIVQLLAEGKTNKEVAAALNIAVKTVETHRAHVMRKLGLHSISDLVRYAVRNNMLQP